MRHRCSLVFIVLVSLVIVLVGCSPSRAGRRTAVETSPPGSAYTVRVSGSGYSASILLRRSLSLASGEASIAAAAYIDSRRDDGTANKLVEGPLTLEALNDAGKSTSLSTKSGGVVHGPVPSTTDIYVDAASLPSDTSRMKVTIHFGETQAAADRGASVTVPVSAIPAVEHLESLSGHGVSPSF